MGRPSTRAAVSLISLARIAWRLRQASQSSSGSRTTCSTCRARWLLVSAAAYSRAKRNSSSRPVRSSVIASSGVTGLSVALQSGAASSCSRRASISSMASATARCPARIRPSTVAARWPSVIWRARGIDRACSACANCAMTASTRVISAGGRPAAAGEFLMAFHASLRRASSAASPAYWAMVRCMSACQWSKRRSSNIQCRSRLSSRMTGRVRNSAGWNWWSFSSADCAIASSRGASASAGSLVEILSITPSA
ncbi:hypothetical protein FQZ97_622470 [compost metagenome]